MTTIVYRDGIIAADSRTTTHTEEGGTRIFHCEKLYRKVIEKEGAREDVIFAAAGESFPSLVFIDWYGSGTAVPDNLVLGEADFTVLVLKRDGLWEFDKWCRGERIIHPGFYAVGSGAKAALGALHAGCSAKRACEIACLVDPFSGPPVTTMRLPNGRPKALVHPGQNVRGLETKQLEPRRRRSRTRLHSAEPAPSHGGDAAERIQDPVDPAK